MTAPRIVVGMGCFNEEQYLDETIPAVLNQTLRDFHFLIIDNGSTDRSWDIIARYAAQEDRMSAVRLPEHNASCPDATNKGWTMALNVWNECRWFVGAGADDLMDRDYLAAILDAAERHSRVNLIFSPMRFIGQPHRAAWTYPPYNPARVHEQLMVPGWRAFTRDLWETNGPEYTGLNQGSDWEWICRASIRGILRPYQLPRSYVSLRVRTDRQSQSDLADRPALHARMHAMMREAHVPTHVPTHARARVRR